MKKQIGFITIMFVMMAAMTSVVEAYVPGGCQCTDYVKDEIPAIQPYNLTTIGQKEATINMAFPTVGSAAVHDLGTTYGHVSVVRNVVVQPDGSLQITVQEKNWDNKCDSTGTTTITTRTGTESSLQIVGYFDPRFPAGDSHPVLNALSTNTATAGSQFWTMGYGSGFSPSNSKIIILGGWCSSFGQCEIPNNVIDQKTTGQMYIPITLGNPGNYHIYIYNPDSGKTSQGRLISISAP